jgi:hypothetical protein
MSAAELAALVAKMPGPLSTGGVHAHSRLGPWRNPFPEWEAPFPHAKILGSKNRAKPPHLTIDGS